MAGLHRAFDATSTWVTELSWWKFFLFAMVSLVAANILQDELFSGGEEVVVRDEGKRKTQPDTNILIDDSGIHFNPRGKVRKDGRPGPAASIRQT